MSGKSRGRRQVVALTGGAILAGAIGAAASAGGALHAEATIRDGGGTIVGQARFTEDAAGRLHANVQVSGLTPGLHGIHIHAVGSCDPFAAAGGHLSASGQFHGLANPSGPAHAGDWPNLIVNDQGNGHLDAKSDRAALSPGALSVLDGDGSALVIHADPDNQVDQPIGLSGARIACGVITSS
jgi:Cu-Zn family superoxide dismutase